MRLMNRFVMCFCLERRVQQEVNFQIVLDIYKKSVIVLFVEGRNRSREDSPTTHRMVDEQRGSNFCPAFLARRWWPMIILCEKRFDSVDKSLSVLLNTFCGEAKYGATLPSAGY